MSATELLAEASGMCVIHPTKQQDMEGKHGQIPVGLGTCIREEPLGDPLRARAVRQRRGHVERFRGQCRAMMSQSGADIARGQTSGRRAGHGGRQEGEGR